MMLYLSVFKCVCQAAMIAMNTDCKRLLVQILESFLRGGPLVSSDI